MSPQQKSLMDRVDAVLNKLAADHLAGTPEEEETYLEGADGNGNTNREGTRDEEETHLEGLDDNGNVNIEGATPGIGVSTPIPPLDRSPPPLMSDTLSPSPHCDHSCDHSSPSHSCNLFPSEHVGSTPPPTSSETHCSTTIAGLSTAPTTTRPTDGAVGQSRAPPMHPNEADPPPITHQNAEEGGGGGGEAEGAA